MAHQTSWLESTGVCGVQQNNWTNCKLVGVLFEKEPNVPLLVVKIVITTVKVVSNKGSVAKCKYMVIEGGGGSCRSFAI